MTKHFLTVLAVVGAVYLGYMCWLTGYTRGYDQGAEVAWEQAEETYSRVASREPVKSADDMDQPLPVGP